MKRRTFQTVSFFFFNDTATTEIYTLSLHDALPISRRGGAQHFRGRGPPQQRAAPGGPAPLGRSPPRAGRNRRLRGARSRAAARIGGDRRRVAGRAGNLSPLESARPRAGDRRPPRKVAGAGAGHLPGRSANPVPRRGDFPLALGRNAFPSQVPRILDLRGMGGDVRGGGDLAAAESEQAQSAHDQRGEDLEDVQPEREGGGMVPIPSVQAPIAAANAPSAARGLRRPTSPPRSRSTVAISLPGGFRRCEGFRASRSITARSPAATSTPLQTTARGQAGTGRKSGSVAARRSITTPFTV